MNELPQILAQIIETEYEKELPVFLTDVSGSSISGSEKKQKLEEILFFPRKKLKMQKIKSGNWEPRAWFIEERLEERITGLELPTEFTREAITSGFRSAIVKEKNGRYMRLKGVSQKAQLTIKIGRTEQYNCKGMCLLNEAISEQIGALNLAYSGYTNLPILPGFIESHLHLPPNQLSANSFIDNFNGARFLFEIDSLKKLNGFQILDTLCSKEKKFSAEVGEDFDHKYRVVSGLQIAGDTRLDEAIYNLTKKNLTGDKKGMRDELLYHLCFLSGIAKAELSLHGFSWAENHIETNNHIGNFVIFPSKGMLRAGVCDLGALKYIHDFKNNIDFSVFLNEELKSFREDFMGRTFSFPCDMNYRFFSKKLRENCFHALQTGYYAHICASQQSSGVEGALPPLSKVLVPSDIQLSESDFRGMIDYVAS